MDQDDNITAQLGFPSDPSFSNQHGAKKLAVAGFRPGHITMPSAEPDDQDQWGGVALIDCLTTRIVLRRMVQAGSEISTVPETHGNSWEY